LRYHLDPTAVVTERLQARFTAEPSQALRELLDQLQAGQFGICLAKQFRTLQRRVKEWRMEDARMLIFGVTAMKKEFKGCVARWGE
jgi:hypothetical protein